MPLEQIKDTINKTGADIEDTRKIFLDRSDIEESSDIFFPDGGWRAWSVVLGSFLGLVPAFGIINSVGAIQTYVSNHQLVSTKGSTISWIFSIYSALCFAFGIFVGPYFDKKGSFKLLTLGTLITFGGFMALANCTEIYQFILALSICVALGNAMCITPLVGVISHWFYYRRGSAIGIATIGGSVGGMVIPLILRSLFQSVGYEWAIRVLGFFSFGCLALSTVLARERKDVMKSANISSGTFHKPKVIDIFRELRDLRYTFMIIGAFTAELSLLLLITYYSTYAISQGMSESSSYLLLTIFNACGIAGRIVPGILSDKFGSLNLMVSMLLGMTLSMFLLWFPFGYNFKVLYAFAAISGFFTSSILTLTPVCLGTITPVDRFGSRYGLLYFFVSIADLFGIPIGSVVIGKGSKHEYDMFALLCSLLALTGTFFWLVSRYCIAGFKFLIKV